MKFFKSLIFVLIFSNVLFGYDLIFHRSTQSDSTYSLRCATEQVSISNNTSMPDEVYSTDVGLNTEHCPKYNGDDKLRSCVFRTTYITTVNDGTCVYSASTGWVYKKTTLTTNEEYIGSYSCDKKPPLGDIPYPTTPDGSCQEYTSELSLKYSSPGGKVCDSCYSTPWTKETCKAPMVFDDSVYPSTCTEPVCKSLSSQSVNIPKSSCVNGAHFNNFDKGYSGVLAWQDCDSTCYVLEIQPIPCTDLVLNHQTHSNCDIDLNIDTYKCVNSSSGGLPTISSSCTPKNEEPTVSPCTKLKKTTQDGCFRENKILVGDCQDNGIMVTSSNLKCEEKIPNCNDFHQHLDTATNTCKCDTGYSLDTFGTCNKPFAWDDNSTDNNTSSSNQNNNNQNNENQSRNHADNKKTNDLLQSNSDGINDLKNSLSNTNNTLAGIRSDLNTSNNILSNIKHLFSDKHDIPAVDTSAIDKHTDFLNLVTKQYKDFSKNSLKQIDDIKEQYNKAYLIFKNGHYNSKMNSGTSPDGCFSTVVFGHTITLSICPFFSKISPIIFFVFNALFMVLVFRWTLHHFTMSGGN